MLTMPPSLARLGVLWARHAASSHINLYVTNVPGPPSRYTSLARRSRTWRRSLRWWPASRSASPRCRTRACWQWRCWPIQPRSTSIVEAGVRRGFATTSAAEPLEPQASAKVGPVVAHGRLGERNRR